MNTYFHFTGRKQVGYTKNSSGHKRFQGALQEKEDLSKNRLTTTEDGCKMKKRCKEKKTVIKIEPFIKQAKKRLYEGSTESILKHSETKTTTPTPKFWYKYR